MEWIFISPHLDDVALSCGGLVWEMAHEGKKVAIWTICAGDPPCSTLSPFAQTLHLRWQVGSEAVVQRRAEDINSCKSLGVAFRHFSIPDCIYRQHPVDKSTLYPTDQALFGELHPSEHELIESLAVQVFASLSATAIMICPLSLGKHVDHQMTRAVFEKINLPLWYYADYPYVLKDWSKDDSRITGLEELLFPISNNGIRGWIESIGAHVSQVSSFWPNTETMQEAIYNYYRQEMGIRLWKKRIGYQ